jgi:hypothetical protein
VKASEERLENLRNERDKIIKNSTLPKYMEITDEWIIVDKIPYKMLNTARKIEVGIDLVQITWTPLRVIRIENGWELDDKTMWKIIEKIKKKNFSIFIETPHINEFTSIIIENGNIK